MLCTSLYSEDMDGKVGCDTIRGEGAESAGGFESDATIGVKCVVRARVVVGEEYEGC